MRRHRLILGEPCIGKRTSQKMIINIPSYGKWFGSYDFWNLTVAAEISVLDRMERLE
jgi:hypothetical protein